MRLPTIRAALLATLSLLLIAPAAQGVVTPVRVVVGPDDQYQPFANDTWVTYWLYDGGYSAVARRRSDGVTVTMNAGDSRGSPGGLDPGRNIAIYQQWTAHTSAIYLYDLVHRSRRLAPGVNSAAWEWGPRISSSFISFFRNRRVGGVDYINLMLYDRDTEVTRRIASLPRARYTFDRDPSLWNGSVGDRYVTWQGCPKPDGNCDVWVYDTVEHTTKPIHGGVDAQEYGGAVDEANGYVFFTRSGNGCGVHPAIWRIPVDHLQSMPTKVADLPDGYDTGWVASIAENGVTSGTDYYFERGSCNDWNSDVYVAKGVDTA